MIAANLNLQSRKALVFALASERLTVFYEHQQWPDDRAGEETATVWLMRQGLTADRRLIRDLSRLSDEFAKSLAATLSREAGLYTAHEMNQSLDPNYQSPVAMDLLEACEQLIVERALDQ